MNLATPAHLVFPPFDAEALEAALLPPVTQSSAAANAAAEASRKESLSGSSSLSGKKSVKEIVASIDPRVRVEPEVEDVSYGSFCTHSISRRSRLLCS